MRSVTSYFNPTLFKKNVARFWPLWGLWLLGWMFIGPLNLLNQYEGFAGRESEGLARYLRYCMNMNEAIVFEVWLGAAYAVLVTMAVFGYLFNHRSAATIHALPIRRENLFVTNYLSGLAFMVAPVAAAAILMAVVEVVLLPGELSGMALSALWQAFWAANAAHLFFYSFAVFCAQFTGNVLALPAFFGILNGLVVALYYLCAGLGEMIFYGGWPIQGEPVFVKLATPLYAIVQAVRWEYVSMNEVWDFEGNALADLSLLELGFEEPGTLAGYALAGVVLAALALAVYRRRHIESAGDVVSVSWVKPIFRVGVAVCLGLFAGVGMAAFFGWYDYKAALALCVLLWTPIGYIIAEMLVQKSFRVFRKCWRGCLVTTAAMSMFVVGMLTDVLGVETWTPDPGEVEWASIDIHSSYPYDDGSNTGARLEEQVQVEQIVDLHEAILRDHERFGEYPTASGAQEYKWVNINYQIGNATYTKRYNQIPVFQDEINDMNTTTGLMDRFVNDPQIVAMNYNLERGAESRAVAFRILNGKLADSDIGGARMFTITDGAEEVWAAVQRDFAEGNLGQRYLFDDAVRRANTYYTDLNLRFLDKDQDHGQPMVVAEEVYVGNPPYDYAVTVDTEGEMAWNWSMTVTLTPQARHTLEALRLYGGLGSEYELVEHDQIDLETGKLIRK